ncbi:hypothetical protein BDW22DRAFT_1430287 [Trametopsis cervina]|nr:hypothetical protein BDW22DRAFT_1430287 [Trametopsis cervina]
MSPIPDSFYLVLMQRMRRLQEMVPKEKEVAKMDIELDLRKLAPDDLDNSAAGPPTERIEGFSGGTVAADHTGGVNTPDAPESGGDSRSDIEGADAPRGAEKHEKTRNTPEIVAGGLEPDANVDLVLKASGRESRADNSHDDEQDGAILEDTAELNSEAAGLPHNKPSEDTLPEAAKLSDTKSPNDARPEAENVADNPDALLVTRLPLLPPTILLRSCCSSIPVVQRAMTHEDEIPFVFLPQLYRDREFRRGHLRFSGILMGPRGTALYIRPRLKHPTGLDVHALSGHGSERHALVCEREAVVADACEGLLWNLNDVEGDKDANEEQEQVGGK